MTETNNAASMRFVRRAGDARETPGIYALWCKEGDSRSLLNILESENIKLSFLRYMQLQSLRLRAANHIEFSAFYTPDMDKEARQRAAQALTRRAFTQAASPVCLSTAA